MRYTLFCFFLFIFSWAGAQEFGGEPVSVKWQQVNTDTLRVIFPTSFDSVGGVESGDSLGP